MNEPLQQYETGPYGELTARLNPDGFAVITIPPIEAMLPIIASRLGRELSADETEAQRMKAPSMVVKVEEAEKMLAARARAAAGET